MELMSGGLVIEPDIHERTGGDEGATGVEIFDPCVIGEAFGQVDIDTPKAERDGMDT